MVTRSALVHTIGLSTVCTGERTARVPMSRKLGTSGLANGNDDYASDHRHSHDLDVRQAIRSGQIVIIHDPTTSLKPEQRNGQDTLLEEML